MNLESIQIPEVLQSVLCGLPLPLPTFPASFSWALHNDKEDHAVLRHNRIPEGRMLVQWVLQSGPKWLLPAWETSTTKGETKAKIRINKRFKSRERRNKACLLTKGAKQIRNLDKYNEDQIWVASDEVSVPEQFEDSVLHTSFSFLEASIPSHFCKCESAHLDWFFFPTLPLRLT